MREQSSLFTFQLELKTKDIEQLHLKLDVAYNEI